MTAPLRWNSNWVQQAQRLNLVLEVGVRLDVIKDLALGR